jgi:uncharacterized protein YndB with AHSA1/START domain
MPTIEIRVEKVIQAEPMRVWEVLEDHEGLYRWLNFTKTVRRRPGMVEPNGVGALRTLYRGRRVMEERITAFEPGRRLEYDVVRGAPGWTTHGEITLTALPDGSTLVWWRVTLNPYLRAAGPLIKAYLGRSLDQGLERLKDRLEPECISHRSQAIAPPKGEMAAEPSSRRRGRTRSDGPEVRVRNIS